MASYRLINQSNQVRGSYSTETRPGRSKAQMCLTKILHIISSFQPYEALKGSSLSSQFNKSVSEANGWRDENRASFCNNRGFDIDLNLWLGPPPETEESESPAGDGGLSACSAVGKYVESGSPVVSDGVLMVEKSSEGECEATEGGELYGTDLPEIEASQNREEREASEITNRQVRSSEESKIKAQEENDGVQRKERKNDGFLGLLVEAAKLVSGDFGDDEAPEPEKPSSRDELRRREFVETETVIEESNRRRSKRNECWMVELYGDLEDTSPVVRSKRGRTQVLPYRYRDSVLEPWKRLSRHRSTKLKLLKS